MAQSLLTIDMITAKALEILENNLVITRNVNRQYDDSFARRRRQDRLHAAYPPAGSFAGV